MRRKISFQEVLVRLTLGSVLLTVFVIGIVAFWNSLRSLRDLKNRHYSLASDAAASEVWHLLDEPSHVLQLYVEMMKEGAVAPENPEAFSWQMALTLRQQEEIGWLSYSDDASGRFIGVWRDADGRVILNRSSPEKNNGKPEERYLELNGETAVLDRGLPAGYDPREKDWYKAAIRSRDAIWTEPYKFNEGKPGMTIARRVENPATGKVEGVFTVDFFLADISRELHRINSKKRRIILVLSENGNFIAKSSNLGNSEEKEVAATMQALPATLQQVKAEKAVPFTFKYNGEKISAGCAAYQLAPGFRCYIIVGGLESEFLGTALGNLKTTFILGIVAIIFSTFLARMLAARIAAPLIHVSKDLARIAKFELVPEKFPDPLISEIAVVNDSVYRMKAGLRSFGYYVPTELVRELIETGSEAELGGQLREMTIFFSDIEDFTRVSEIMPPDQLVDELGEYLDLVTNILEDRSGTVDKFMGDGIMAFFNAPTKVTDHVVCACHAALLVHARLSSISEQRKKEGRPVFKTRMGIHTGEVVVGNIGTPRRFAYTVIGDAVNLASRVEGLNKIYGTNILATQASKEMVNGEFEWRKLDSVAVKGRNAGTLVYELLGTCGNVAEDLLKARSLYEEGLHYYFEQQFEKAIRSFQEALRYREDRAAHIMIYRAGKLMDEPPPKDWNGIYVLESK